MLLLCAASAGAITAGQVDDFQDGTLQGWSGGNGPTNQANGGPAGAGDRYLAIDSGGSFLGSFNTAQWSGDYQAAAVAALAFDLNNFGPDPLAIRIMILTPGCGGGSGACTAWTSTQATALASGSGWTNVAFSLGAATLTRVLGSDSLAVTLQNVERVLIRHQPGTPLPPGGLPGAVDAVLGIDNVTALPEPSLGGSLALGALALAGLGRRRVHGPPGRCRPHRQGHGCRCRCER